MHSMKLGGLTTKEAKELYSKFGPNIITTKRRTSPLEIFLSQFPNAINAILVFAALLSFFLNDILDGVFILAILALNGVFGFFQEFKAEKAVEALNKFIIDDARVLRDGKEQLVNVSELVPGDIVILSEGERVPADGKLLQGMHMEVDEALLTGESLPVLKIVGNESEDKMYLGTTVIKGYGKILVEITGERTGFGQIAKTLSEIKEDRTLLHIGIDRLGKQLTLGIILIALGIVLIGFLQKREFFSILLTSTSIAVAAIPEGLPAVITIALALGMQRMAKKKAIVRKMAAIETLGATQVILTDKTGTLTKNEMQVKKLWHGGGEVSLHFLFRSCLLGNTATLAQKEGDGFDVLGDKTDGALLLFVKERVRDFETFRQLGNIIDEYVFDPTTKTITVVWKEGKKQYVFVRGQPERILSQSLLTDSKRAEVKEEIEKFARDGLRVIAFGYKKVPHVEKKLAQEELEKDLTFLGFVGIYDPVREEAKEAVQLAREAGIRTIMVTGDNEITALSIAREVGLISKNEDVILGSQLHLLSDEQLSKMLDKTSVFARVTPMDKLRLVESFKKAGYVVGVTGDGVNDALALKRADVGLAMGLSGTDVAKGAADIIITDDNFATLVQAIEEGRKIYNNIVRSITYLLSGNLAELSLVLFATILNMPVPLLPTQILWINLVTDGLPALALAADTKDPGILKQKPRNAGLPLLSGPRLLLIAGIGFTLALILLVIFSFLLKVSSERFARSVTFSLLVFFHLIIPFIIRGKKNPLGNKMLLLALAITFLLQSLIILVPGLRTLFHIGI